MALTHIYVCTTCKLADEASYAADNRAGARLHKALQSLAGERQAPVKIIPVECLSVCKRACTISFAAEGKWTYVYGDLPADTGAVTILDGAALYAETLDGLIPWKLRPDALKRGVISRVPPLVLAPLSVSSETSP
jgi:predicted metal-binding protein